MTQKWPRRSRKIAQNSGPGSMFHWDKSIWQNDPEKVTMTVKPPKNSVTGSMSHWGRRLLQNDLENDPESCEKLSFFLNVQNVLLRGFRRFPYLQRVNRCSPPILRCARWRQSQSWIVVTNYSVRTCRSIIKLIYWAVFYSVKSLGLKIYLLKKNIIAQQTMR